MSWVFVWFMTKRGFPIALSTRIIKGMKEHTLTIPWLNQIIVIGLAIFLLIIMSFYLFRKAFQVLPNQINAIILTWSKVSLLLGINIVISYFGFLETFSFPPRMPLLAISFTIIAGLLIIKSPLFSVIRSFGSEKILLFQVWRLIPEMVIFVNVQSGIQAEIMTFTGNNYDILTALTAPILYFVTKKYTLRFKWILIWNVLSLINLIHTLMMGVLSAPYPIQVYMTEPSNQIIGFFPMTIIPLYFVPVAILSHLFGIFIGYNQIKEKNRL
ncbi:hypothetical protein EHQ92_16310 [Leptospira biflexa]|nr:hypothetical protein EHQ92_16310 [Leptospira biflexa]TGM44243.1 hypothetical protein EHQ88_16645 [Leptospira biflexa]